MRLRSLIHAAFHDSRTTAYRLTQRSIWALITLSIALFVIEVAFYSETGRPPWFVTLDRALLWVFGVELVVRIASWRPPLLGVMEHTPRVLFRAHVWDRIAYTLHPMNLVDLLTVLALVPALRGLRALRLLRLLRGSKLFQYSSPFRGILRAFEDHALLYGGGISVLGLQIILGGVSLFLVERAANPAVTSIADGIWWALVTITTVGFGDITPNTPVGRVIAGFLMVGGMFTLALFAGIVGHSLLSAVLSVREDQFRMSTTVGHLVIFGYGRGARMLLDALAAEVDPERQEVVLMGPRDRPDHLPPEFRWVQGDPTKESELGKVRLTHARAVIIVGDRQDNPQEADAGTILTCFTIRSYVAKSQKDTERRKEPLYVVAEILDSENVQHARSAGADEVIETTRLGFSLVAHAITMPGTAQIVGDVATVGANSLYVGPIPANLERPLTAQVLARWLKTTHGAMLLGLRDERTNEDQINPPDDMPVEAYHQAVYLATRPVLSPRR